MTGEEILLADDDRERREEPRVAPDHLQRILADCAGNVSETARRLGITRRTVQLELKHGQPS